MKYKVGDIVKVTSLDDNAGFEAMELYLNNIGVIVCAYDENDDNPFDYEVDFKTNDPIAAFYDYELTKEVSEEAMLWRLRT